MLSSLRRRSAGIPRRNSTGCHRRTDSLLQIGSSTNGQRTNKPRTRGQQLREARLRARLKPKDLARKAKGSVAAVYNCERTDGGGRVRTLLRLARAAGSHG